MFRSALAGAAALALMTAPVLLATPALAQTAPAPAAPATPVPSPVVVFNAQALVQQTAAGRDMGQKTAAIAQAMSTELQTEAEAINAERDRLLQTPQAQTATPQYQQAQAAFQRRAQAFEARRQRTQAEIQATERLALSRFEQALAPVLVATVSARNAVIALESGSVSYAVGGVDITADLVRGLDAATTTINVQRVQIQTEEEAAAAAAAAGASGATPAGAPLPRRHPTPVPVPR